MCIIKQSRVKKVVLRFHFVASITVVRQGENLSPVLFSFFLNNLTSLCLKKYMLVYIYTCWRCEKQWGLRGSSVFRLFLLLYADDTVILAENAHELQTALNAMLEYCYVWNSKMNSAKTKVVIFSRGRNCMEDAWQFSVDNENLE
jgi:hypothetical protein